MRYLIRSFGMAALLIALSLMLLGLAGCRQASKDAQSELFPEGTSNTTIGDAPASTERETPKASEAVTTTTEKPKVTPPTDEEIAAAKKAGIIRAVITTAKGDIEVELNGKEAPLTVANFVKLARAKFYDGLNFHRVETNPAFRLIQGGCPDGTGGGGPGYQINLEISPKLRHDAGAIAMARSNDPNSAGSQFYICINAVHELDDNYAVFGKVTKGLEHAGKIAVGDKIIRVVIK